MSTKTKYIIAILILLALSVPVAPADAAGVVTGCDQAHLLETLAGDGSLLHVSSDIWPLIR